MTNTGRPRDVEKDAVILKAARDILLEVGYDGLSIAAIAQRAGVGRPTIYRRWPSIEQLIENAIEYDAHFTFEATGDLRADVHALVAEYLDFFARPTMRAALPSFIAGGHIGWKSQLRVGSHDSYARSAMRQCLAQARPELSLAQLEKRADAVIDLMIVSTTERGVITGLKGRDRYCSDLADTLVALALSQEI
ncbi:TetR/AcrR family transcriptional regulator [Mycobacteroides abscessus]